jgi:RHH-type proline utilization regulon transcriptional repressor/proline dehydrogenase/delta 1-pyrroline-5-carboxylate dehydrogenase
MGGPQGRDEISVKLSALYPRFEDAQRGRVMAELLPRLWTLVQAAAQADINLAIDAEECDRLELSLDLQEALAARVATEHPQWGGLGLALQTYQTRALELVDEVAAMARRHRTKFVVRLVKGAYWDGEVKRAQEGGLPGYPVFTHKRHTDICYLASAARLIGHHDVIYPQFASHNAGTIAAIVQMARAAGAAFELQRLHGMGEGVHREVLKDKSIVCRVYAPVGEHRDLLAYLVRRLLENGANSSFVHQLADENVGVDELLASPLAPPTPMALPLPVALFGDGRRNSMGVDLACAAMRAPLLAAIATMRLEPVEMNPVGDVAVAMQQLQGGRTAWQARPLAERAALLHRAADLLEARLPEYCALLVKEAHKTLGDCVAEVREAVDFCRYYADQALARLGDQPLPGPTGESNLLRLHGRGVFVCISPWNFPLAIFAGQVVAALVAGNTVAAKPAEQTPVVARRFVALLHEVGVPADALQCLHGTGETVGAALVAHPFTAGVCFTGSTAVARLINRTLAAKDGPIVPLIAETGGLNAMIVDSTALHEQVVDAVVQSAFRSAGQRCSALRLLCVHESIADGLIEMLQGAMAELSVGDPAHLATDVGPLIDDEAFAGIAAQVQRLRSQARLLAETPVVASQPAPAGAGGLRDRRIADLREEIFGPVLHVVRWGGDVTRWCAPDQRAGLRPDAGCADAHRQPRAAHRRHRARGQRLRQPQHHRRRGGCAALRRRRASVAPDPRPAGRTTCTASAPSRRSPSTPRRPAATPSCWRVCQRADQRGVAGRFCRCRISTARGRATPSGPHGGLTLSSGTCPGNGGRG